MTIAAKTISMEPIEVVFRRTINAWIRGGNKAFRVSQHMVDALSQVELNIMPSDYHQPYEHVKVILPNGTEMFCSITIGEEIKYDSTGKETWEPVSILRIVTRIGQHVGDVAYVVNGGNTFEEKFNGDDLTEEQAARARTNERIAINAMLLAVHYPTRVIPAPVVNIHLPRRIRWERQVARHEFIEFIDQNIKWYEEEAAPAVGENTGNGSVKRSHWRKGHYRRQRIGPGRLLVKLIFIKPVLVNAEYYTGGGSQTTYIAMTR